MAKLSDRSYFSILLTDTIDEIKQLEEALQDHDSRVYDKTEEGSLVTEFLENLKTYVENTAMFSKTWDSAAEIYARILSAEKGEFVSEDTAEETLKSIVNNPIERAKRSNGASTISNFVYKSMVLRSPDLTNSLLGRWIVLLTLAGKETALQADFENKVKVLAKQIKKDIQVEAQKPENWDNFTFAKEFQNEEGGIDVKRVHYDWLDIPVHETYEAYKRLYGDKNDTWRPDEAPEGQDKISAIDKINAMIGMHALKKMANEHVVNANGSAAKLKEEFLTQCQSSMIKTRNHIVLKGNPGTGKTTVANLLGQLFMETGDLSKGHVVQISGGELTGQYLGETKQKVIDLVEKAKGGVLFIDEAYILFSKTGSGNSNLYEDQAIAQLLNSMENEDDLVVVMAGYPEGMQQLIESNEGLPRRVRHIIDMEDYTIPELMDILSHQLVQRDHIINDDARMAAEQELTKAKEAVDPKFWGNGGVVRDYLTNIIEQQELRLNNGGSLSDLDEDALQKHLRTITLSDVKMASVPNLPKKGNGNGYSNPIGFRPQKLAVA
jgi:stage V sporulation protein K